MTTMKKKRWTPEQYRAWRNARNARLRELQAHIDRISAELAARQKPA
jgi:trans-aconitate methyltransferase